MAKVGIFNSLVPKDIGEFFRRSIFQSLMKRFFSENLMSVINRKTETNTLEMRNSDK